LEIEVAKLERMIQMVQKLLKPTGIQTDEKKVKQRLTTNWLFIGAQSFISGFLENLLGLREFA